MIEFAERITAVATPISEFVARQRMAKVDRVAAEIHPLTDEEIMPFRIGLRHDECDS